MATSAELQAELDMLRAKMAEADAVEEAEDEASPRTEDQEPDRKDRTEKEKSDARSELERVLAPHGVSASDIEALADQLWKELDTLPQNRPLMTAIGAFALGFLLGRMTK